MVKNSARTAGTLYIVATPIGNREDISLRALATLKSVDAILAEDTRHSSQLLHLFGIHKPLYSLHAHNEGQKSAQILQELEEGLSFALISDAGTPLICDPGFPLVRQAREKNINVVPIPGPCALITALSVSGIPCDSFIFIGFLPSKQAARCAKLESLGHSEHTVLFYESTHRIIDCLDDLIAVYGPTREIVIGKELTKAFERVISGEIQTVKNCFLADTSLSKGEFVFILPPLINRENNEQNEKELLTVLLNELPLKQAVKIASLLTKKNKNLLYKLALEITTN